MKRRCFLFAVPILLQTTAFAEEATRGPIGACPLSADFVVAPDRTIGNAGVPGAPVASTELESIVLGGAISIECIQADLDRIFPGMSEPEVLEAYLDFWEVGQPPEWRGSPSEIQWPIPHHALAGSKQVAGETVTYRYRLFSFPGSFALVKVGTLGVDAPLPVEVQRFIDSLMVLPRRARYSEDEWRFGVQSHMAACLPAISMLNEAEGRGLSQVEIFYHCSCVGNRLFRELTREEHQRLATGVRSEAGGKETLIRFECMMDVME